MKVVVYTTPNCVQCDMTKKILSRDEVDFSEVDISTDSEAHDYVTSLGYKQSPVVVVNDEIHWSVFRMDKIAALRAM